MLTNVNAFKAKDTSADDKEKEEHCPVCNKVWTKSKPTLAEVRNAINDSVEDNKSKIKALSDETMFGYCGSIATGKVGDHKPHKGMEPDIKGECGTKYDIDGFVICTEYALKIRKFNGKRWAYKNKTTRDLENKIRGSLKSKPALKYIRGGKKGFSMVVYAADEESKVIKKGGIILIF